MKLRHLLVTTDLSEESLRPLPDVLAFARELGARVTLLHVVHDSATVPASAPHFAGPIAADVQSALEGARALLDERLAALAAAESVTSVVVPGDDVVATIRDYAREHDVDAIVAATHGRSGFRRLVLGSVVEAISRVSDVPVLTVPLARYQPSSA